MLEEIVEKSGHILLLSSKYHAEVAGQGIEYWFGRPMWWYKKNNPGSTVALRELLRKAFGPTIVTVDHVHKIARKARDYQRVYSHLNAVVPQLLIRAMFCEINVPVSAVYDYLRYAVVVLRLGLTPALNLTLTPISPYSTCVLGCRSHRYQWKVNISSYIRQM